MPTTAPPTRSLDALLRPASVAVIGASNDPTRIGGRPIRYLRAAGYAGRVYPVNPRHQEVQGLGAFPHISDVPEAVDLAIVAVPAPSVVETVEACAARGVQVAVIYSAGFAEMGAEGRRQQRRLGEIAAETGLRVVGPNCLGVYNSELGFFATFSTTLEDGFPAPGGVALVSQSGAYGSHLSLLARKRNIDVRYWVTTGNEADVSVPEVLGWLAEQDDVSVIMAHAEGITDREALVQALGTARARRKPVVFQKVGVTEIGAQAAQSHTASLAGADPVYEAAFRQFGAYRARDTDEMLDVAYAASFGVFPESPRVALVSISGGVGVQMADAAVGFGLDVAPLGEPAQKRLKAALPYASPRNPVDITAQAFNRVELIADNLGIVFDEEQHDAVVAFFTYVAAADGMVEPIRAAVHAARERRPGCALILSIVAPPDVVRRYEAVGCPVFEDPTRAVRAVAALHRFSRIFAGGRGRSSLSEGAGGASDRRGHKAPSTSEPARRVPSRNGRRNASSPKRGYPVVEERARARPPTRPHALPPPASTGRWRSSSARRASCTRPSSVGWCSTCRRRRKRARPTQTITSRARSGRPGSRRRGRADRADDHGRRRDDPGCPPRPHVRAGRHVRSGRDTSFVEVIEDVSFRVAPFGEAEARRMVAETRAARVLRGTRGRGPYDTAALAAALSRLSIFAAEHRDRIDSAEINRSSCSRKVTAPSRSTP